jgi:hypothetical protein
MTLQSESNVLSDQLLRLGENFSKKLPQSQGARIEGKGLVLTFIVDEKLPADKNQYAQTNIDRYAVPAYKEIFSGQDEIDLLLLDARLVFSVLFWDGQALAEEEFVYFMNDLSYLAAKNC